MSTAYLLAHATMTAQPSTGRIGPHEVGLATVQSVSRVPHGAVAPTDDLTGRRLPVLVDRRRDFRDWAAASDTALVRSIKARVLRPGAEASFELADGCLWFGSGPRFETTRDEPGIRTDAFASLGDLLTHLLKHPGAFGASPDQRAAQRAAWCRVAGIEVGDGWIDRIARGGCPLQRAFDRTPMPRDLPSPCARCGVDRRNECLGLALSAAQAYTQTAVRALASTAEPPSSRHIHFEEVVAGSAPRSVVASLSDEGVEVIAKGSADDAAMKIATCFLAASSHERPAEVRARRRLHHIRGFGDTKRALQVCTEGGWRHGDDHDHG